MAELPRGLVCLARMTNLLALILLQHHPQDVEDTQLNDLKDHALGVTVLDMARPEAKSNAKSHFCTILGSFFTGIWVFWGFFFSFCRQAALSSAAKCVTNATKSHFGIHRGLDIS